MNTIAAAGRAEQPEGGGGVAELVPDLPEQRAERSEPAVRPRGTVPRVRGEHLQREAGVLPVPVGKGGGCLC